MEVDPQIQNCEFYRRLWRFLPEGVAPSDLMIYGKKEWWRSRPRLAVAYALRKCPKLDWKGYLESYPDVKEHGLDPVLHFINHGLFENRQLETCKKCVEGFGKQAPLVSIIVPNFNNAPFLRNSLESLFNQTLKNIEIIMVDDYSNDDSLKIANEMALRDQRLKIIAFDKNNGTHVARKKGILAANGKYIMFLDPDDSFTPDACECAYKSISTGYDIVVFNINFVIPTVYGQREAHAMINWYNSLPNGVYSGREMLGLAYQDGLLPHFLWNRIYASGLIKKAFSQMADGDYRLYEDQYEWLVIVHNAKNLLKINDRLINYRVGGGIIARLARGVKPDRLFIHSDILGPIQEYCLRNKLPDILEYEKNFLLGCSWEVLPALDAELTGEFFEGLAARFGALYVAERLERSFRRDPGTIIRRLAVWKTRKGGKTETNLPVVGIFLKRQPDAEMEDALISLCRTLEKSGLAISLFSGVYPESLLDAVRFHNVCFIAGEEGGASFHLEEICRQLERNKTFAMIFTDTNDEEAIWLVLLLRLLYVRSIGVSLSSSKNGINVFNSDGCSIPLLRLWSCYDLMISLDEEENSNFHLLGFPVNSAERVTREKLAEWLLIGFTDSMPAENNDSYFFDDSNEGRSEDACIRYREGADLRYLASIIGQYSLLSDLQETE